MPRDRVLDIGDWLPDLGLVGAEAGALRFPEYGNSGYRPPAGAAIVFSCNLLHEVTEVTQGRRFVVVTFFYGEAEAAELARRMAGSGR